MLNDVPVVDNK